MLDAHFNEDIKGIIHDWLDKAKDSIYVCVCWFTDADLLQKLCDRAKDGIRVSLMLYDDDINQRLDFSALEIAGGKYFKVSEDLMHNKFCVIDENIVLIGSPNWTYGAGLPGRKESLAEIVGELKFAEKFINEFHAILDEKLEVKREELPFSIVYKSPHSDKFITIIEAQTSIPILKAISLEKPQNEDSIRLNLYQSLKMKNGVNQMIGDLQIDGNQKCDLLFSVYKTGLLNITIFNTISGYNSNLKIQLPALG